MMGRRNGQVRFESMRLPRRRNGIVWSLLLCLVVINGFMAAPSVGHAAQHANHQAGTHSSGFCAWVCAASEGIETSSPILDPAFQPVDQILSMLADQCERVAPSCTSPRGPPVFFD
jgi:hypothetical protein